MKALKKLPDFYQLLKNMGFKYVLFRIWFGAQRKSGILKLRFRSNIQIRHFITREEWRALDVRFFLDDVQLRTKPNLSAQDRGELESGAKAFEEGKIRYFGTIWYANTDWHTNPENQHVYKKTVHFSEISEFSERAGDIKFVWEKSRFTFLYDLIRYDMHFKKDQSVTVFSAIENWIRENPVNCGPNWICSQEISIRILNWTFALQYYKNADTLSEPQFDLIINSIFSQIQHVEDNRNFSRIAVRNNHALTEGLAMYLVSLLYPFLPGSAVRKMKGKKWFEEEMSYQIADDGTFLQFSMNYHRVVVQLLTWAIRIAEINGEKWADVVYDRAVKTLHFLESCQEQSTGWLPNYGANDGALLFPLSSCHFRDFRPSLLALSKILGKNLDFGPGSWEEETWWLGAEDQVLEICDPSEKRVRTFKQGGYYVQRDKDTMTFLRCGSYRTRPSQADNLHLDIWVDGQNILRDGGSYRYNTCEKWADYFAGTSSHNTIMLGDQSQMRKGERFIWHDWIKKSYFRVTQTAHFTVFDGQFEGFGHVGKGIVHRRRVTRENANRSWMVEDWIENAPLRLPMVQIWHPIENFLEKYTIRAFLQNGAELVVEYNEGWYSESYGHKRPGLRLVFCTGERYIKTVITSRTHKTPPYAHFINSPVLSGRRSGWGIPLE
jgi:hypothetical protein